MKESMLHFIKQFQLFDFANNAFQVQCNTKGEGTVYLAFIFTLANFTGSDKYHIRLAVLKKFVQILDKLWTFSFRYIKIAIMFFTYRINKAGKS